MNSLNRLTAVAAVLGLLALPAVADPEACLKCHARAEFEGLDAAAVKEDLADSAIPPHRPFAELTEAEVAEILEALQ